MTAQATGSGLVDWGSNSYGSDGISFFLHQHLQNGSETPTLDPVGALFSGTKKPKHEADHSCPSNAEFRILGPGTSHSKHAPMA